MSRDLIGRGLAEGPVLPGLPQRRLREPLFDHIQAGHPRGADLGRRGDMVAHLARELIAEILQLREQLPDPLDLLGRVRRAHHPRVRRAHHPRVRVGVDQLQFVGQVPRDDLIRAARFDPGKGSVLRLHQAGHRLAHGVGGVFLLGELPQGQPAAVAADQGVASGRLLSHDQRLHQTEQPDILREFVDSFRAVEVLRVAVDHPQRNVSQLPAPFRFRVVGPAADVAQRFRDVKRHYCSPPSEMSSG